MKAVILDMYGVIITDGHGSLMPFVNEAFPRLTGADVYPAWLKACVGRMGHLDFWRAIGFCGDVAPIEREYLDSIEIDRDFYAAAAQLSKHYRLALLSNDISEWSAFLRGKFELDRYFERVVISGDAGIRKPEPRIFEDLLSALSLPPGDCLFVDDRQENLRAARKLGIQTCLFDRRGRMWDGPSVSGFPQLIDLIGGPGS